ncbi:NAD/NADP octopine/nopaline dehydrogenase family protein [Myroides sp. M-43]|uniref:NAD/NADP-dependent octopine/nopaline dehydrogenase family protein n=1 Tax=Myroides oncorhynchi TaxID=2893756 RepID=UPI001E526DC5|nr:NAD/NADP-dependent octopine/nopaline dehydrogenase family protein [Myroides oncorhynchi]MCC9043600.1 NAD/NADP octopine/nopaline dehydrogenase family protein [Myroides oncorhynchi]
MKIGIIGSGNAGCAHAFKLTENGHQVNLIKTSNSLHEHNFDKIVEQGGIWAIDNTNEDKESFQKINLITRDIALGLKGVELVLVLTQSLHHNSVAEKIAPFIDRESTKVLFCVPGNLGSLYFKKHLGDTDIVLAEGESTPFDARIVEPGTVNILFKNVRNAVAFLPNARREEGMKYISQLVDTYGDYRNNIVESALHNPNLIVHTVGVIMSANRIEKMKGEFWMYRESFSPAIWNLVHDLDKEKNNVIEKFKGQPISYLDACKYRNELDLTQDSLKVFQSYAENGGPKGPDNLNTRFLHEDVIVGLGSLSMLGKEVGVSTPVTDSLITIASSLVKKDFFGLNRTKEELGIADFNEHELIAFVNE